LLQHRQPAPWGWAIEESITEYADGRLVCAPALLTWHAGDYDPDSPHGLTSMGSDGAFRVRCTTDTLTGAEALAENTSLRRAAKLRIASGTAYLDGGYVLPHAPEPDDVVHTMDAALDFGGLASIRLTPGTYAVDIQYIVRRPRVAAAETSQREEAQVFWSRVMGEEAKVK
jgi:hypothetical protein